jgi:uncharacterized protein YjbI with pentapeptide repeats
MARFERAQILGTAIFGSRAGGPLVRFIGEANFTSLRLAGSAWFHNAQFYDRALFVDARIDGEAAFAPNRHGGFVIFVNEARFDGAVIAGIADFTAVQFQGMTSFERTNLGAGAKFGPDRTGRSTVFFREADFTGTTIAGDSMFSSVQFHDRAFFTNVAFRGEADFSGTQYRREAYFPRATIDGIANFRQDSRGRPTTFRAACVFEAATFRRLVDFSGARFEGDALFPTANFEADAWFEDATFFRNTNFRSVDAKREMFFSGSTFTGFADFDSARLRIVYFRPQIINPQGWQLEVIPRIYPDDQFLGSIDLRGMTYERMYGAWRPMLGKNRVYDSQPYAQLEQALRRSGNDSIADDVFYAQRVREFRNRLHWPEVITDIPRILWDLFLRLAAGYGVRPFRLVLLTLFVLAWGTVVYGKSGAVAKVDGSNSAAFDQLDWTQAFWVSLDQLLPVEFPGSIGWEPTSQIAFRLGNWGATYEGFARFQALVGWAILPVALAILASRLWRERATKPLQ